jgi:hypothetical protein
VRLSRWRAVRVLLREVKTVFDNEQILTETIVQLGRNAFALNFL